MMTVVLAKVMRAARTGEETDMPESLQDSGTGARMVAVRAGEEQYCVESTIHTKVISTI